MSAVHVTPLCAASEDTVPSPNALSSAARSSSGTRVAAVVEREGAGRPGDRGRRAAGRSARGGFTIAKGMTDPPSPCRGEPPGGRDPDDGDVQKAAVLTDSPVLAACRPRAVLACPATTDEDRPVRSGSGASVDTSTARLASARLASAR